MSDDAPVPSSIPNLAGFVSSTIGRVGALHRGPGVVCVRSPIPVANGFVNAAFVLDGDVPSSASLDDAVEFFGDAGSPFVAWVPDEADELVAAVERAGGVVDHDSAPDMWIDRPVTAATPFAVRPVSDRDEFAVCARLCEEAYGIDGMAWLMEHHEMFEAPGVAWVLARDGDEPVGAGCAFLASGLGGIYYVSTPSRHGRRGVARAVTGHLTNLLLDQGARSVVLQSSAAGLPVYQRLGFATRGYVTPYRFG